MPNESSSTRIDVSEGLIAFREKIVLRKQQQMAEMGYIPDRIYEELNFITDIITHAYKIGYKDGQSD